MKRILCLIVCILLLCGGAYATDEADDLQTQLTAFMRENGLNENNFSMSYYNLSTGESYAFRSEAFLPVGTVWTLPLHMYYYEQESLGAFDPPPERPDEVYTIGELTLEDCRYHSILRGDAAVSEKMREQLGSLEQYQTLMNDEYGHIPTDALPREYQTSLRYSAEFLMNCLKELTLHSESFGALMQNFSLVQPVSGFAGYGRPYTLVHILGEEDGMLCDVGIVSAPQPYLLVCFTSAKDGKTILAQLNALVCSFVEEQTGNTVPATTVRSTERSDSDFVLSTEQNDHTEVLRLIAYAIGAMLALASVVAFAVWCVRRRRERKKWED